MGSSPGDNKRKTLAIALPLSLSLVSAIAITAIISIVRWKARSKRLPTASTGMSGANGNGEEQAVPDTVNDPIELADEDQTDRVSGHWNGRTLAGNWWKTFRAYFLDSTVLTYQE